MNNNNNELTLESNYPLLAEPVKTNKTKNKVEGGDQKKELEKVMVALLDNVAFGMAAGMLPIAAALVVTAMMLAGKESLHLSDLGSLTGVHMAELDHAAISLRAKRFASFRHGILSLTHPHWLKVINDVKALRGNV